MKKKVSLGILMLFCSLSFQLILSGQSASIILELEDNYLKGYDRVALNSLIKSENRTSVEDKEYNQSPIAGGNPKFLGNIYSGRQRLNFENYWNQVTPENAGKWGSVESSRDIMQWEQFDRASALAKDNGFPFKLHVLIWGNQQPSWIENLPPAEQLEEIKEWFQELADRYPDIDFVEVVNEALHDPPNNAGDGGGNYINALGGTGATGWDWVLESFRLARQYFPDAELMLNDYNIINNASNVTKYLQIVDLLKAENLIDQIGVQAHAFSTTGSISNIIKNLDELALTGLPIYVTELDIDGLSDEIQLEDYQRIFPALWEHPAIKGITLWGYRPGLWRTETKAYLIEDDGVTERPALVWLRSYVESTLPTSTEQRGSEHIKLDPNPVTSGEINIQGIDNLTRAELYDLNGRLMWSDIPSSNQLRIDPSINTGFYVLRLYEGKNMYAKKIMILQL